MGKEKGPRDGDQTPKSAMEDHLTTVNKVLKPYDMQVTTDTDLDALALELLYRSKEATRIAVKVYSRSGDYLRAHALVSEIRNHGG